MNEPVAIRYCFDGYGYLYMDAGSGSDWASRVKNCEFLYTHPHTEDFSLTDEEITQCLNESMDIKDVWGQPMIELNPVNFARALLNKASEK